METDFRYHRPAAPDLCRRSQRDFSDGRRNTISEASTMRMFVVVLPLLITGGLLLNHRLAQIVKPDLAAPVGMTKAQQTKLEEVAAASLFGQFRSNMADFLWMKVDKYLHSGVDLRGLTEEEKRHQQTQRIGHAGDESEKGHRQHATETTIVLAKENDWRGVLGDIERDVKPYLDMRNHSHRDPKEALPLFRLMTWSNPHFIPGYAVGAMMIAHQEKAFDEAIRFIREGEINNPESIEIQSTFSYLYMRASYFNGKDNYAEAVRHAERGIHIARARDPETLIADEREAWQECVRRRVIGYREMKQPYKARQAALEGLTDFPEDVTCRKYLESVGEPLPKGTSGVTLLKTQNGTD
ncbi:MAG: hypothetical protein SFU56_03165 [Capsulimonadales bacterium]|nr:hypothetical protein [Capsulimonadales bacterium]